jgi:hypothetical protein
MTLKHIGNMNMPNYTAETSDIEIDGTIITDGGANMVGQTVFLTDTQAWKIIGSDLVLVDYASPSGFPASVVYSPIAQASTNAWAVVAGSILNMTNSSKFSYTIQNSGAETISWKILAGNTPTITEAIEIKASADILTTARDSYSTSAAVWRYYGLYIIDKVGGAHGAATVLGITKS